MKKHPTVYVLEIRLLHTQPPIWRILHLKRNMTMLDLHAAIQEGMGWRNKHYFEFVPDLRYPNQLIGVPDPGSDAAFEKVIVRADEIKISEVFHFTGDKVRYVYDLGDNWEHEVELRGMIREEDQITYPQCPSGYGACPPEDVGGIPGFIELLRALKEKDKKVLKEYDAWLGKRYDPDNFRPASQYSFPRAWKAVRKRMDF